MAKKLGQAKLYESQKLDTENDIARNLDEKFCWKCYRFSHLKT